jgi:hypothetical protein
MGQNVVVYPRVMGPAVLLLDNLPDDVTPDMLFTLVGVYADVDRVKILYNKKGSALVQVREQSQASQGTHSRGMGWT